MIDRTKNHVYIITIHYWIINGAGVWKKESKRFTSLHGIQTEPFKKFLQEKLKEIKWFERLDEEWGEQYTVPLSDFCN